MRSKILLLAALAGLIAGAAYLLSGKTSPSKPASTPDRHIATATLGNIESTLRLTGQTSARTYVNMTAPMLRGPESNRALVLMKLVKPGAQVKKGELVAQIDAQATRD